MNAITKTNSVAKTVNKATVKKATVKKAKVKKSENVILKTKINNDWKLDTRSMSALVRYAKGNGAKGLQSLIDATNEKNGTKVSLNQIANIKNIVANATERELFKNANEDKTKGAKFIKGEKKTLFSFWLVLLTVGRMAKK
tara:strand:- start:134 stop:556 length:423 start_codon:yes stop_codon:yes gene_type:complete